MADRVRSWSPRWTPLLLALICAAAAVGALWISQSINTLRPDSASYLYFDASRSFGYPAFLELVRSVTGNVALAVPVQILLLAGCLFVLGWSFHRIAATALLSIPFQLLLVASPEMWRYAVPLLTEGLSTAFVALWCAQLLRSMEEPSVRGIALLSGTAGVAMMVKPSLLPLFLGTAFLALLILQGRERWLSLVLVAVGLLLFWAATPAANYLVRGSAGSGSPVARGVLQHTLFCAPNRSFSDPDAAFVEQIAAPVRRYVDSAPEDVRDFLSQRYSGQLRFGQILPTIGRRHGFTASWQTDPIIQRIAVERVAANPACYARSVANSYFRLVTHSNRTPAEVRRLREFLESHPPVNVPDAPLLPSDADIAARAARELGAGAPALPGTGSVEPLSASPLILILGARALYTAAAVAGIAALLFLIFARRASASARRVAAGMAALGLALHGVLALTAAVEFSLMRYTVPLWPIVCTLLGLVALIGWNAVRRARSA